MLQKPLPSKTETIPTRGLKSHFFRSVSQSLHSHKLGDLLVASGLISGQQLERALEVQKVSGEQLGSILIRQKTLTAVQLYQKLAEQWCMKAATAGIAVMMQMSMPLPAQADEGDNDGARSNIEFTLASATVHAGIRSYPSLFGTEEVRSNDITAFKKWTDVMKRFEDQMHSVSAASPRVMMWKEEIRRLRGKSAREQIAGINDFLNQVPYVEDIDNYGKSDYWATPIEFLTRGGDCEDFAIAKYASLRALGFSTDQLRIAIVKDRKKNDIMHAILVVYSDDGDFVLDNQDKQVEPMQQVSRYEPIFSINSSSWWRHHA